MAAIAASASSMLPATTTPFPPARPVALITTGAPRSRAAATADAASECQVARAVGTPARNMTSFANRLFASNCAAALEGPKAASPRLRNRSASPAASGPSGPTNVQSTRSDLASAARPSRSVGGIGRQVAIRAKPGFPGAATSSTPSPWSFQPIACSRPPPPTIRTFTTRSWDENRPTGPRTRRPEGAT